MEPEDFQKDVRRLRAAILLWCIATLAVFSYVIVSPVTDLVYQYVRADGTSVDITYGPGWYPVTGFVVVNYLLLVIAFSVVADPESPARVDLHQLAVYAAMVGNVLIFITFLFYYLFWINSLFGGYLPFNDFRWPCVYYAEQPQFSPNTIACVAPNEGLSSHNLSPNHSFRMLWVFSVVFFAFSAVHRVFNLSLRRTGAVTRPGEKPLEGEVLAFLVNASNLGFYVYWAAWPLLNTIHTHGYPTLGIPPGPGVFQSTRYNAPWVALALLALNILPPILFQVALTIRKTQFWQVFHFWITIIITIVTFLVFLALVWWLIPLIGYCNSFNSAGSICNDDKWCGKHFADAPDWCNNVTPIPNAGPLLPNSQYVGHIVMTLVFVVYNGISVWLNYRMRKYGIFPDAVEM